MTKRTRHSVPRVGTARKRIVILGLPPVDAFDIIGPAEVFTLANQLSEGEPVPYTLELVCSGPNAYLDSETGIGLKGQDIEVDVRKALRRLAGFFDLKWETIDGRPRSPKSTRISFAKSARRRSHIRFSVRRCTVVATTCP